MSEYRVVIVGTDGSDSSFHAVDKAAEIAAEAGAKLIVASAYLQEDVDSANEPDQPRGEDYKTQGAAPVYEMLRRASKRARDAGVEDVEERPIAGAPVDVLVDLAEETKADLLVVGNVGLNSLAGRLVGSVPSAVKHRAKTKVLVVETTD